MQDNGYQMTLPDLQQMIAVSAQQSSEVSKSPRPLAPGVSPMMQQAAALQQLNSQQQQHQQQLAAAAAAAAGVPSGMLTLTLQQQLAAAQAALSAQAMGLQGIPGVPLPPTFPVPNDTLFTQFINSQHPGHSDVSHLTLNLSQPVKTADNAATRSIQRSRSETGASSAYASRHQAAEQRRRTRINERLDRLRKIVPHAERANTATFLEEVINYIGKLKAEIATLKGEPIEPLEPLSAAHPTHTLTDAHTTATNDPTITVLSAPAAVVPETVGTSASPPAAGEGK